MIADQDAATDMQADDTSTAAQAAGGQAVAEAVTEDASGAPGGFSAVSVGTSGGEVGAEAPAPRTGSAAEKDETAAAETGKPKAETAAQEWELMDIPHEWRPRPLLKVRSLSVVISLILFSFHCISCLLPHGDHLSNTKLVGSELVHVH